MAPRSIFPKPIAPGGIDTVGRSAGRRLSVDTEEEDSSSIYTAEKKKR